MNHDAVARALSAQSAGRTAEAETILRAAADRDDPMALCELAFWHLGGTHILRDLVRARAFFARAAELGHGGAGLIEVAFTANGAGSEPDWSAALMKLRRVAATDALAAQHLQLLEAMALDRDGHPARAPGIEGLNEAPHVRRVRNFCTPVEAAHLVSIVMEQMQPATVFDPATGRQIAHPIRTSDFAVIGPYQESLVIQAINRRIAAATGTHWQQGEPLSVLRYSPGQQYRDHLDVLPSSANQRVITAILYLNKGFHGGATVFPKLGLTIEPEAGDLLIFDNVDQNGQAQPLSRHAGLPVTAGTKWIATRWIRMKPYNPWTDFEG